MSSILSRIRAWPGASDAPASGARLQIVDVSLAAWWIGVATLVTFLASGLLDPRLLDAATMDVWFEADLPRMVEIASSRWAVNERAAVHPLFALLIIPPTHLRGLLGLEPWTALRLIYACLAGLSLGGFFAILRLIGCRRFDATIFTLVGLTSAGALFWAPIPETHTLAQPTIILAILVVAVSAHRVVPVALEVAVSGATLGVTVTNWMAGVLISAVRRSWRQTLQITIAAFALVLVLWLVQKALVPSSPFFIGSSPGSEHMLSPESRGPLHVAGAFFFHTVVVPEIVVVDRPGAGQWPIMIVQPSSPGSGGAWSLLSAVLWGILLGTGGWALFRLRGRERMRAFLGLLLGGQLVLFLLFGNETFLYAPNFLPLLLTITALGALTGMRPVVLAVASVLVITNGVNGVIQWRRARAFFNDFAAYHHDQQAAMELRPEGPWPRRGNGTAIQGMPPGAGVFGTGMLGPGGALSGGLDLFRVEFWIQDGGGMFRMEGGAVPPEQVETRLTYSPDSSIAMAHVGTPYYQAEWAPAGPRHWRLRVTVPEGRRVALVVRASGVRRAVVRDLLWEDVGRLWINGRWVLESLRQPLDAFLVDENLPGWVNSRPSVRRIAVPNGWAAARLELLAGVEYTIDLRDADPAAPIDRILATIPPRGQTDRPPRMPPVASPR